MGKIRLGIAPIGWNNDDMPELGGENTFEQIVSEIALAGFEGTEIGRRYPKDGAVLKKALTLRGLTICNAWCSTFFLSKPEQDSIDAFIKRRDFLYEQGARVIGCCEQGNSIQGTELPVFANKPVYTEEQWKKVVHGMNLLANLAEEKGMKMALHHHMGTGVQTLDEIDRFMESTNENVYLLYDSGHIVFSEGNVESAYTLLNKHLKRIAHVHIKDMRKERYEQAKKEDWFFLKAVREGVFTVPGDGMIDFKPIIDTLVQSGYEGWLLVEAEQDPAKANPLEYAFKAMAYMKSVLK